MGRAFTDISFTDSVKNAQTLYGSREGYRQFEEKGAINSGLDEAAAEFIAQRDSFYQASVSESGWPYVQHRGGPVGFVRVIDSNTIGYADFRGNRQYISVGNLMSDNRISLIFMDYANRRRLKVWGRVKIVHMDDAPELLAKLENLEYRARIERGVIIHIEAIDWNCPQHITPRFTEAEFVEYMQPLQQQIEKLSIENAQLRKQLA